MRKVVKKLNRKGVLIWDLSNIFDVVKKPIFLDFTHVESEGNELIARALLPKILAHLPNPQLTPDTPDAPDIRRDEQENSWGNGCQMALKFDPLYLNGKNGKLQLEDLSKNGNNGILCEKGFIRVRDSKKSRSPDFTISCQFLVGKTTCRNTIFEKSRQGKRFASYRLSLHNKGILEFHMGNRSLVIAREIRNLKWYHLVLRRSGTMITAWLDGVPVAVSKGLPAVIEYDPGPLIIGGGENDNGNPTCSPVFFGYVDQFVTWNRVLSDLEINGLFDYSITYNDYCAYIARFYQQVQYSGNL